MGDMEIKETIKRELKWWKWIVGSIAILVVFLSNLLANKMFYEESIKDLHKKLDIVETIHEEDVKKLENVVGILSFYVIKLAIINDIDIPDNPYLQKK